MTEGGTRCEWVDLLDPTVEELRSFLPPDVHDAALDNMVRDATHDDEPRPRLRAEGSYVFGILIVPVVVEVEDRIFVQEIDVLITATQLVTIRKTPPGDVPFSTDGVAGAIRGCRDGTAGMAAFHLLDGIAERYLDLTDDIHGEIDELEDKVEDWPDAKVRSRIGEVRHDLLRVRRVLSPMRDAVYGVVDGRVEIAGTDELFPRDVELHFREVHDKLMRCSEALEFSRDLLGSVRDYHQAKVANQQNEVMKRLTVVASLLLVPTFIVGVYGQNFDHMPELHWARGYGFSWLVIVVTTVGQLIYFRRRRWM